jgi:cytidylate kinase
MESRPIIIAFCGLPGSGRSAIAEATAQDLRCPMVAFGSAVRRSAGDSDIFNLQKVGQSMVLADPEGFVTEVLAQNHEASHHLVLDGLRHVETLLALKRVRPYHATRLFHVKTDITIRQRHLMGKYGISPREVAAIDAHIVEAQLPRILPQYATKSIDGSLSLEILVALVKAFA